MLFTMENTLNEVLYDPALGSYITAIFPKGLFSIIPENMYDKTLAYLRENFRTPWGSPVMTYELMLTANMVQKLVASGNLNFTPLWYDCENLVPKPELNTKESVFLSTFSANIPGKKPAVIIVPGGGYMMVSLSNEGYEVGARMEEAGYKVFILNYRTAPKNHYPAPQLDLALAVKFVKLHAEEYGVDPDNILLMGSSAGGHLCASFALLHKEYEELLTKELEEHHPELAERYACIRDIRPNALGLSYPVVSFVEEPHEPSFQALSGGDESLREKLSVEKHLGSTYPKTFVWACEDDPVVPHSNTIRMYEALQAAGVDADMRLYPTGGHGCCLAIGTSAEGWIDEMLAFLKK